MSTQVPHLTPDERRQTEELLHQAPFAFVAVVDKSGPYVVPMNFAYDPGDPSAPGTAADRLLLHTGAGRKTAALAEDPRVCVALTADAAYKQGPAPCDDGFAFRAVLVEGRAILLEDAAEREAALRAIVAKYDPGAAGAPFDEAVLAETLVYAVVIESMSYKQRPRHPAE